MDNRIADLHIHSIYSHDSWLSPKTIVRKAIDAGLTCIAITDHGTIRGGIEARKNVGDQTLEIIIGTEIRTDCGDIMGLELSEEIRSTAWKEVIREIRDQGGIAVFPHPYRDHTDIEEIAGYVDFIECWNARSIPEQNSLAADLARRFSKPVTLGSDAHVASEIGSVQVRLDRATLRCENVITTRYSTEQEIRRSRVTSLIRQGKWGTLILGGLVATGKRLWY
jgi:hypothetical protein